MPVSLTRQHVDEVAKGLSEIIGSDIGSAVVLQALAKVLHREPDGLASELNLQVSRSSTGAVDDRFDFPRDPRSSFNHITGDAIRPSVIRIVTGFEYPALSDPEIRLVVARRGAWHVPTVLMTAASYAFLKGLDPSTNYDAALVKQCLEDYGYTLADGQG